MNNIGAQTLRVGYIVKMFPRLSETFILNEILELERSGVEVVVFSLKKPSEGRFHPQLSRLKAQVFYLEDLEPAKWANWIGKEWSILQLYSQPLWGLVEHVLADNGGTIEAANVWHAAWVAAQAHRLEVDHLHAHFASLPSTIAYYAHLITGIPFSFTAHAKDIFVYSNEDHYLDKKIAASAFTITVTDFNRRYLQDRIPASAVERIRVLHNGIDLDCFSIDAHQQRDRNHILAVGRLVAKKGLDDLLSACAILKSQATPLRCTIVGDGPERASLENMCRELGLESEVKFVGAKIISEVLELMRTVTVFCLPCTVAPDNNQDALPTVLLEALACGLPVVSTTVSGIPEIVDDGVDGLLAPPNQPAAVALRLAQILQSPVLQTTFAQAGRVKAEAKFDIRKNVARLRAEFEASARNRESSLSPLMYTESSRERQ